MLSTLIEEDEVIAASRLHGRKPATFLHLRWEGVR
jgi:hypothetical protein